MYVQEAMSALGLPCKEFVELVPSDVLSNSSHGTSASAATRAWVSNSFVVVAEANDADRFAASNASAAYSQTASEIARDACELTPSEIDAVEVAADGKAAEVEAAADGSPDSVVPLSRVPTASCAPRALEAAMSVGLPSEYNPIEGIPVQDAFPTEVLRNTVLTFSAELEREKERARLAEERAKLSDFKQRTSEYVKEFTLAVSGEPEGPRGAMFYLRLGMLPEQKTLNLAKFLAVTTGYRERYRFTPQAIQGAQTRVDTRFLKAKDSRPHLRLVRGMLARRPHARKHLMAIRLQARARATPRRREYLRSREVIENLQAVARLRRFRRAKRLQAAAQRFIALSRYRHVRCLAISSERLVRGFLARCAYSRAREAAIQLQAAVRMHQACAALATARHAVTVLSARSRCHHAACEYGVQREAATRLQAMARRGVLRLAWQRARQAIQRACISRDASRYASSPSVTLDEKQRILYQYMPEHTAKAARRQRKAKEERDALKQERNGMRQQLRTVVDAQIQQRFALCERAISTERFTWSSVAFNDELGKGHAQPALDSPVAWCPAADNTDQWLMMDLSTVTLIGGIVVQGRCAGNSWKFDCDGREYTGNGQYVISFKVEVSVDGMEGQFTPMGEFDGVTQSPHSNQRVHATFPVATAARFVRIRPLDWPRQPHGHIAMRCGLLVPSSAPLHVLEQGASLPPGANLISPNGQYTACMQEDGNLVVYRGSSRTHENVVWKSSTAGRAASHLTLWHDGNLVIFDAQGAAVWSTHTEEKGSGPVRLEMQDSGRLVLLDEADTWQMSWPDII